MANDIDFPDGNFHFWLQAFAPQGTASKTRLRPVKVEGWLSAKTVAMKNPPCAIAGTNASATANQGGGYSILGNQIDTTLANYDRGHLVAETLGGPNNFWNVVPMYQWFNRRGPYRKMELTLESSLSQGKQVHFSATIKYGNSDGRIPSSFQVTLTQAGANSETQTLNHVIPVRAKITIPAQLDTMFKWGKQKFDPKKHLMPASDQMYPTAGPRPYAILDYLATNYKGFWPVVNYFGTDYDLTSGGTVSSYRDFSGVQRAFIKYYNAWLNDGWLVSDGRQEIDPDKLHGPWDECPDINEQGCLDSPEIDHIIPWMSGGSNFYSNARLISWYCNNKQARNKIYTHLLT